MTITKLIHDNGVHVVSVVAVTAIVWMVLVAVYINSKRRKFQNKGETTTPSEPGRSGLFTYPAVFAGHEHGLAISQIFSRDYYQFLLAGLQKLLLDEGYAITFSKEKVVYLTDYARNTIARELIVMREQYLAPLKDRALCEQIANESVINGSAEQLLERLIAGNKALGYYITMPGADSNWHSQVLPFRQMKIVIKAKESMLVTRDVVRCLQNLSAQLQQEPFPKLRLNRRYLESVSENISFETEKSVCYELPGYFPGHAGIDVPPKIAELHFNPISASDCRQYIILVQGYQSTTTAALAALIDEAARRIAEGEETGASYDDDYGYAFKVCRT